MLKIKSISKHFGGVKALNGLDLEVGEGDIYGVIGPNGSGKSTLLDALTFVLFNKPFRKINKTQLINTVNEKDCLVELEFDVNAREYVVRRGMKPTVFDIEVNGNPLHKQSDDRANQRLLEENKVFKKRNKILLKCSYLIH